MPRNETPISELSIRTINNMRSEVYQLEKRIRVMPDHPSRPTWEERVIHLRKRLGDEIIPFSRRNPDPIRRDIQLEQKYEQDTAQLRAQEALDEMSRKLEVDPDADITALDQFMEGRLNQQEKPANDDNDDPGVPVPSGS